MAIYAEASFFGHRDVDSKTTFEISRTNGVIDYHKVIDSLFRYDRLHPRATKQKHESLPLCSCCNGNFVVR